MRYSTAFDLVLYDLGDKWSHENWNSNMARIDDALGRLEEKTKTLNTSTAEFTESVTAPRFIGNSTSTTKLQTARNIKIGNQTLSFDGTDDLEFTLLSMDIAERNHTHAYLPLTGGLVQGSIRAESFIGTATDAAKLAIPINVTIGDTTKQFDGSDDIEFTKKEIGATGSDGGISAEEDNVIVIEGSKITQTYASGMVRTTTLGNGVVEEVLVDEEGAFVSQTTTTIKDGMVITETVLAE